MTPTTITHDPAAVFAGAASQTQKRINAAHAILASCGYSMSPSKVARTVRQFEEQAERNGWTFFDFLANKVALTEQQRRQALTDPDAARAISYADPTGERACRNVMARRAGGA